MELEKACAFSFCFVFVLFLKDPVLLRLIHHMLSKGHCVHMCAYVWQKTSKIDYAFQFTHT